MRRLFEGGVYSKGGVYFTCRASTTAASHPQHNVNFVLGLTLTPARTMADLELIQFSFSSVICGHHVHNSRMSDLEQRLHIYTCALQLLIIMIMMNAATIRGRPLLLRSAHVLCGVYSRAASIRGAAFI